jgi:DNA-directed RNA polymerase specialized sigma24 family protein
MKHVREHVEDLIIASLSVQRPDDLPDWMIESDFKRLFPDIKRAMDMVILNTHISGFTDEDLSGFMYLKAHQLLRGQKYDFERSAYTFFYVAFKNLTRDIVRRSTSQKTSRMRVDLLDMFEMIRFEEEKGVPLSVLFPDAY